MPTVTASTPMPIMPLLPEFDSLSPGDSAHHSVERQKAVVASVKLHCMFGAGAW